MSRNRAKGTLAESALVKYLTANGFPHAERRALAGELDKGDITGTIGLAWEVKNAKTYKFPAWLDETKFETENAKADFGILIVKPNGVGVGNVQDWWAVLTVEDLVKLIRDAGYGDPR